MKQLFHPKKGILTPAGERYQALGNKRTALYADQQGNKHILDGTETDLEKVTEEKEKESVIEQNKVMQEKETQEADDFEFEKILAEMDRKEATSQAKEQKHSEVLETMKGGSEAIVEAVRAIEMPEGIESVTIKNPEDIKGDIVAELSKILSVLEQETDKEVVEAIQAIKLEIPTAEKQQFVDYTKQLKEISEKLDYKIDLSPLMLAISMIPTFSIPEELIKDGRIKVEVDRISLAGANGGLTQIESESLQAGATEETLQALQGFQIPTHDSLEINYTDATKTVITTIVYKLAGVTVATKTFNLAGATKDIISI